MKTGTKAQMLELLKNKDLIFKIPEFILFQEKEFLHSKKEVINTIKNKFNGNKIIIRSSSAREDAEFSSNAGRFLSKLNIDSSSESEIEKSIIDVLDSYKTDGTASTSDEFIVQLMLEKTTISGVIFTHDLNSGAPYYVINYDDISGLTNTITSGDGRYSNKTLSIHRSRNQLVRSDRFQILLEAVKDLESKIGNNFLDIEFALDNENSPYLFQVRPITTKPNWNRVITNRVDDALSGVQEFLTSKFKPIKGLNGFQSVFGHMPDWNPVEMIGKFPTALSYSLYEKLITSCSWSIARDRLGYRKRVPFPLMVSLCGQPYIDVRLSFNSFLPRDISDDLGERLVNAWLRRLIDRPELHDKVEFDVAITNYTFDIDERIDEQINGAISADEARIFKESLLGLTNRLMLGADDSGIDAALKKVQKLEEIQNNYGKSATLDDLNILISDCIEYGTIPFAILARHGFIAKSLLESIVKIGILSSEDLQSFYGSFRTVAGEFLDDINACVRDENRINSFYKKYGHLRPGTYNIQAKRYDQMMDLEFNFSNPLIQLKKGEWAPSNEQIKAIDELFIHHGFKGLDSSNLFVYAQKSIRGREFSKFIFTKSVSQILELVANFGESVGLNREELSHLGIEDFLSITKKSNEQDFETFLRAIASQNFEKNELSRLVRLPQVIFDIAGVHVAPYQVAQPNFITKKQITAELVGLNDTPINPAMLKGKIVMIENADPGFDWVFSHNISGLITKYGGINSHMAIRCAEFGLPAAIGCGEQRFDQLFKSTKIYLDCAAGTIDPIH